MILWNGVAGEEKAIKYTRRDSRWHDFGGKMQTSKKGQIKGKING